MKLAILSITMAALLGTMLRAGGSERRLSPDVSSASFLVYPVGWIHKHGTETTIEMGSTFQDALLGLDGFSHVWVLWWFDRNDNPEKRGVLRVYPRGDSKNPLTGVFATRSPARPNLIGMSLCKIRSIRGSKVRVEGIDAFDNTPVLDLKPYIPGSDADQEATVPAWVGGKRTQDP
jgi:tRNA-Thr(GGU) m(6)t(6)A37 methyltransferase TsaA